jgi:hypothetical protein
MARPERAKKMGINQAQVATAKMLIDKGKPSLQSVESVTLNEWDKLSEDEVVSMAKALILQHPEVMRALNLMPDPSLVPQSEDMTPATGTDGPLQP